ncbi:MAG TPA: GNAT family N-acetyltransferase [Caulobacteraceae bacterium]|nr:GNAT family N-acetyltransferase [Caulobacteraceae bacterium]
MQVSIVEFEERHGEAFRTLNEAWISKHFVIEPKDRETIEDPKGHILAKGGRIFMAEAAGRAIGCVALIPMADGGYEVAKMTVDETVRGVGLGRRLLQRCVDEGRRLGAHRLYLETNSSLAAARGLYLTMGFEDLPPAPTPYVRCDTWMELRL